MPDDLQPILSVRGLVKRFQGLTATDYVDLDLHPGEIHALIGPNGAGKSTLINQICGELEPDEGTITLEGRDLRGLDSAQRTRAGIGRTFQIASLVDAAKVRDNVALAIQIREGRTFRLFDGPSSRRAIMHESMGLLAARQLDARADTLVRDLSHGEKKQLELVMAEAIRPKVLLLDEPMAGLGHAESQHMIETLQRLRQTYGILLVEHDMDAVFKLADRITVLVYGRVIASGSPDEIRSNADVLAAYLGAEEVA